MSRNSHDHTREDGYCFQCELDEFESAVERGEVPDFETDVCQGCGTYYHYPDSRIDRIVEEKGLRNPNGTFPQLCFKCLRGDAPPHEH